jgi:hypothetical protein
MAEIQIEQRRGGLGWLWALIAIVLIALAVWYFTTRNDAADAPTTTAPASPTSIEGPPLPVPAAAA